MLGTNDFQPHCQDNTKTAARGCRKFIKEIMKSIARAPTVMHQRFC